MKKILRNLVVLVVVVLVVVLGVVLVVVVLNGQNFLAVLTTLQSGRQVPSTGWPWFSGSIVQI